MYAELITNTKYNYRDKEKIRPGNVLIYELKATKYIPVNEEVLWYYGDNYHRDYTASKLWIIISKNMIKKL